MVETVRNPKIDEKIVKEDLTSDEALYRFLDQVNRLLQGELYYRIPFYTDLADLDSRLPKPLDSSMVRVIGQGLAVYNGTNWVKASDDTTLIT